MAFSLINKKKVLVICLAGARLLLRPEKKILVICLAGARSLLRPEKKVLVVCLAGAQSLLRPEKKSSSRLSGGCAIVITAGKKKVLVVCLAGARSLLRLEKKSSSCLSGKLCCCVSFMFWREIGFGYILLCTWSTIQLWCCVIFFGSGGK